MGINQRFKQLPNYLILSMVIFTMAIKFQANSWNKKIIEQDVLSLYAYLPAAFIYKDVSLSFMNDGKENYYEKFWPIKQANGKYVIKTTMGTSLMYSPFFFIAHGIEKLSGKDANGYSATYKTLISFAALFYLVIGLIFTRKLLQKYFDPLITSVALLLIYLGTNLFYYTSFEPGMTHVYSFCLIAMFLFYCLKWYEKQKFTTSAILGVLIGLIVLIRPTNILIVLLFLLWEISRFYEIKLRLKLLLKNWPLIALMIITAFMIWIPQLLYWKMQTGSYFINSYNEQFYFNNFHIHKALLGFRKGWFIYTPVMFFAVVGVFFMKKKIKAIRTAYYFFLPALIYVTYSWWCWWYGGSYGARTMIDIYAVMSLPLAALISYFIYKKRITKILTYFAVSLFVVHNIFQTYQYLKNAIHYDSMTKEAYFDSFLRINPSEDFESLLVTPDYERAVQGLPEQRVKPEPLLDCSEKDFSYVNVNMYGKNKDFYIVSDLMVKDSLPDLEGKILIIPDSENPFNEDVDLRIGLFSNHVKQWMIEYPLLEITQNSSEEFRTDFVIPFSQYNAPNLKIFISNFSYEPIYGERIELIIHDLEGHYENNVY